MTTRPRGTPLFQAVLLPIQQFFKLQASSGILLMASALIALVWANSAAFALYTQLFQLPVAVAVGSLKLHFTVHEVINDGLMTLFFFVVGMEIKRELAVGELRTLSRAALPAVAAAGGMVVPALIYLGFNRGTEAASGWAIPMATDIAFSIGVLTLLRGRIHHALVVFLTALAIFDDMGGILVIAVFYGGGIKAGWLLAAGLCTVGLVLWNRLYIRNGVLWTLGGVALWLSLHEGGIHATISGVILGLCIPAKARRSPTEVLAQLHERTRKPPEGDEDDQAQQLLNIEETLEDVEPPLNRFVHLLHPWVAFGVVPLFALANSGVALTGAGPSQLLSAVPAGIILGLVVGKPVGIYLFTMVAVRLKLSPIPGNAPKLQLLGTSVIAGIGFTVAIFVATLAFASDPATLDLAKVGILVGSLLSAAFGYLLLRFSPSPTKLPDAEPRATVGPP